jgi:hypothetical protein
MMIQAVIDSETSVNLYETTQRNVSQEIRNLYSESKKKSLYGFTNGAGLAQAV